MGFVKERMRHRFSSRRVSNCQPRRKFAMSKSSLPVQDTPTNQWVKRGILILIIALVMALIVSIVVEKYTDDDTDDTR